MNRLAGFPRIQAIEGRSVRWNNGATQVLTDPVIVAALGAATPIAGWPNGTVEDRGGGVIAASALGAPADAGEVASTLVAAARVRRVLKFIVQRPNPRGWGNGRVKKFAARTYQLAN